MTWKAPLRDMQFVLQHWLRADQAWAQLPAYADVDLDLAAQVLEEAARFCEQVLAPLNSSGDRQGCQMEGEVRTPDGFRRLIAPMSTVAGRRWHAPRRLAAKGCR